MSNKKTSEVVIIGAGPSGLAAANMLGNAGIETIVLEKSTKAGSKNFHSTVIKQSLYENIFNSKESNKTQKSDLLYERTVNQQRIYLLKKDSYLVLNHHEENEKKIAVLKETLNYWMANIVENSGITIYENTVAKELITQSGKICSVRTDTNDEYYANVILIAEGVNSQLVKSSGLTSYNYSTDQFFLFVEENILLPSEVIEERLNLQKGQGMSGIFFTTSFFELPSIAYLHTNKDSISLSIGIKFSSSISKETNINQFQEILKTHPAIKPIIAGGITNHYNSYMLPVITNDITNTHTPKLYGDSFLLIGGAAHLVNPFSWDFSSLPIESAKIASETIIKAKNLNDFSKKSLSYYEKLLNESVEFKKLKLNSSKGSKFSLSFMKNESSISDLLNTNDGDLLDNKTLVNLGAIISKG